MFCVLLDTLFCSLVCIQKQRQGRIEFEFIFGGEEVKSFTIQSRMDLNL